MNLGVSNEQKLLFSAAKKTGGLMLHSCLHAARCIKPLFCQCALFYLHVKNQPTAQNQMSDLGYSH